MMKNLVSLSVLIVLMLTFTGSLNAASDIFSVNFYRAWPNWQVTDADRNAVLLQDVTGTADPAAGFGDWNTTGWLDFNVGWSQDGNDETPDLLTSTNGSTANFYLHDTRNGNTYNSDLGAMVPGANAEMMEGHGNGTEDPYDGTSIQSIEVRDIPFAIYDVIFYLGTQEAQQGDGSGKYIFNGGPEMDFQLRTGSITGDKFRFDGTFEQVNNGDDTGNYILFKGVTGSSFTFIMWGNGFNHIGLSGFQFGIKDLGAPSVSAGSDWITWSNEPVTLDDVLVVNNDPGAGDVSLTWTAESVPGITVGFDDASVQYPTVTITKSAPTGGATAVTLTLTANQAGKEPVTSTMSLDVYDDACQAAVETGASTISPVDFNGNCVTGFEDLVDMAAAWLVDFSLEGPVAQ